MASRIASSSATGRTTIAIVIAAVFAVFAALIPASSVAVQPPFLACLVTGAGDTNDPSFNLLAAAGLQAAERRGVVGREAHATAQAGYERELRACAQDGAAITVAVGYGMASAVDRIATEYPRAAFAVVDVDVRTLPHRPANVTGVLFREQQAGYLAGFTAGLWAAAHDGAAVGAVGGLDIPPIERALAGFRFGAKRAQPGLRVLTSYSGDFSVPAKCERQALGQLARGSAVEFAVAGTCGAGALTAARAKGAVAIAFGADPGSGAHWVLATALERVDVAVEATVLDARGGRLRAGKNTFFTVANGGIGVGGWSARVPPAMRRAVSRQVALLAADRLPAIPTTLP